MFKDREIRANFQIEAGGPRRRSRDLRSEESRSPQPVTEAPAPDPQPIISSPRQKAERLLGL